MNIRIKLSPITIKNRDNPPKKCAKKLPIISEAEMGERTSVYIKMNEVDMNKQ